MFIANALGLHFVAVAIKWVHATPPGQDSSALLIAVASISVVVWTGALIAFQLKGTSWQLSGAFSLLEYAFLAPLVALLFQGGTLRLVSLAVTFAFLATIVRQCILYLFTQWLLDKTAADDPNISFLATDFGRRVVKAIAGGTIFPISYASACACATAFIALYATQYVVAVAAVGALSFGLYYILAVLRDNKVPASATQQAAARKTFDQIIDAFRKRADALKASKSEPAVSRPTNSTPKQRGTLTAAEHAKRIADLKEVAELLAPLRYENPRPGLLSKEQIRKVRQLLDWAMEEALDDKQAFDAAMALSAILASLAPEPIEEAQS